MNTYTYGVRTVGTLAGGISPADFNGGKIVEITNRGRADGASYSNFWFERYSSTSAPVYLVFDFDLETVWTFNGTEIRNGVPDAGILKPFVGKEVQIYLSNTYPEWLR